MYVCLGITSYVLFDRREQWVNMEWLLTNMIPCLLEFVLIYERINMSENFSDPQDRCHIVFLPERTSDRFSEWQKKIPCQIKCQKNKHARYDHLSNYQSSDRVGIIRSKKVIWNMVGCKAKTYFIQIPRKKVIYEINWVIGDSEILSFLSERRNLPREGVFFLKFHLCDLLKNQLGWGMAETFGLPLSGQLEN